MVESIIFQARLERRLTFWEWLKESFFNGSSECIGLPHIRRDFWSYVCISHKLDCLISDRLKRPSQTKDLISDKRVPSFIFNRLATFCVAVFSPLLKAEALLARLPTAENIYLLLVQKLIGTQFVHKGRKHWSVRNKLWFDFGCVVREVWKF